MWKWSHSVVSNSSWPHGLKPTRLLRPWDFPSKSTGVTPTPKKKNLCYDLISTEMSLGSGTFRRRVEFSWVGFVLLYYYKRGFWEERFPSSLLPSEDTEKQPSKNQEGFPGGSAVKESTFQCRRHGFHPWVRKIPWRRKWQPIPVFLAWEIPWTEKPGGLQSMGSQRDMSKWWSMHARNQEAGLHQTLICQGLDLSSLQNYGKYICLQVIHSVLLQ